MDIKKLNSITIITILISIAFCLLFIFLPKDTKNETLSSEQEYPQKLFSGDIIELNIEVEEDAWQQMLDEATRENYIACNLTVNGTDFSTVAIRPKGNSSLSMVAGSESDRFSFKLEFDHYIEGQTCFGLDKLVLNNFQADNTYMKDYLCYHLMDYMGVNAPLTNYAHITVNGQEWGLYLAVESYEDSFLERTYNTSEGNLYSVKKVMEGPGKEENRLQEPTGTQAAQDSMPQEETTQDETAQDETAQDKATQDATAQDATAQDEAVQDEAAKDEVDQDKATQEQVAQETMTKRPNRGLGGMGGFGDTNDGGSLVYTDDKSESYAAIFDNAIFNKTSESDYQKIITALEKLSKGEALETYFDIDQILRYFAVHTAVVNTDSYISTMQQNYYLYENEGKVTILPWDYNLSFGGFQAGDAQSVINFPIDTPVSGVELKDRPLIGKLLEVPEYKERYHQYLQEIATYLSSDAWATKIVETDQRISTFVKKDATAFCNFNDYKNAIGVLEKVCQLRAEAIRGQLDGTIPATTAEQIDSKALIEAKDIDLNALGSQGGGGKDFMGARAGDGNFMPPVNRQRPDMPPGDFNNQAMPGFEENLTQGIWKQENILWLVLSFVGIFGGLIIVKLYRRLP